MSGSDRLGHQHILMISGANSVPNFIGKCFASILFKGEVDPIVVSLECFIFWYSVLPQGVDWLPDRLEWKIKGLV